MFYRTKHEVITNPFVSYRAYFSVGTTPTFPDVPFPQPRAGKIDLRCLPRWNLNDSGGVSFLQDQMAR